MFLSRNKKNNVYPYKPQFYYIKVGFKGVRIIKACFRDEFLINCYLLSEVFVKVSFVILMNFVVVSSVGMKRITCILR